MNCHHLIVANGVYCDPAIPDYPGVDTFASAGGRVCHASQFHHLDDAGGKHIIVVGHYGCGGVRCALGSKKLGLIDNWLRHVQDVTHKYADHLTCLKDESTRVDRLCELNVIEQVLNAAQTTIVQTAWERGQELSIHGWVYGLKDGLVRHLGISLSTAAELATAMREDWEKKTAQLQTA